MKKLLVAGVLIVLAGLTLMVAGSEGQGSSSVGGVVFIGPFPIAFGSGPDGGYLALASVVIGGVMAALVLLWGWRFSRLKGD